MYRTSDTPNSATIPDDAFIEIDTAAGEQKHVAGSEVRGTRFVVISKSENFTPVKSDGSKAYYRCADGTVTITVPTKAAGGFSVGDEITFINRASSKPVFSTSGVTVNTPTSWALGFNELGSPITLICVDDTEWDAIGDMEVA